MYITPNSIYDITSIQIYFLTFSLLCTEKVLYCDRKEPCVCCAIAMEISVSKSPKTKKVTKMSGCKYVFVV